jgi:hypothetical protein
LISSFISSSSSCGKTNFRIENNSLPNRQQCLNLFKLYDVRHTAAQINAIKNLSEKGIAAFERIITSFGGECGKRLN